MVQWLHDLSLGPRVDSAASLRVLPGCLISRRFILTFSLRSQDSVLVASLLLQCTGGLPQMNASIFRIAQSYLKVLGQIIGLPISGDLRRFQLRGGTKIRA